MLKASKYEASHKIRFLRVVKDDDVDRMQGVKVVTSKPSITNCPFTFFQICTGWVYTFSGLLIRKLETENRNILVMNLRFYFSSCHNLIQVVIARGFHLFPFRTEKLSLVTPMVLRNSGRVGSRRFKEASLVY